MLHQTQVSRVLPKYHEFLEVYPSFEALARAPEEDVVKLWYPLGYNFRPRRLCQIARIVVHQWKGQLPDDLSSLLTLPGIGRYTAGAILSFAFHTDAPILDTNVRRVIQRFFGISGNPFRSPTKHQLWWLAEHVIPPGQGHVFNQALMDFGALICTARKPQCLECIYNMNCQYYQNTRAT